MAHGHLGTSLKDRAFSRDSLRAAQPAYDCMAPANLPKVCRNVTTVGDSSRHSYRMQKHESGAS